MTEQDQEPNGEVYTGLDEALLDENIPPDEGDSGTFSHEKTESEAKQ